MLPRASSLKKVGVCVWMARLRLDEREGGGSICKRSEMCESEYRVAGVMVKHGHVKPECMTGGNALREEPVGAIFEGCAN